MRKPRKYDNDIRSQFRRFIYRVACRLVDIVEKNDYVVQASTPKINKIVEAVFTLMYIFRLRYRDLYAGIKDRIVHREKFIEFCEAYYQHEKLPYFFTFLLNMAMKFEMFLYLREEGHNYFAVFAHMIADDSNYFYFEAKGGAAKLVEVAECFLEKTQNLHVLVKAEYPLRKDILSLDGQLSQIDPEKLNLPDHYSYDLLKCINRDLRNGLERYAGQKVLPFVILRFILNSRVPEPTVRKKVTVEKYFNRCLVPEVMTGDVFHPESSWSQVRIARKQEKMNKMKSKLNESKANNETLPLDTEHLAEDKTYGNGLEWLKDFDAKTSSILNNNDDPKSFHGRLNSVEGCSPRKDCNPFSTGTGTINFCVKQKESSNCLNAAEYNVHVNRSAKCRGSKVKKHKEPDKSIKVTEYEHMETDDDVKESEHKEPDESIKVTESDSENSLNFSDEINKSKLMENFMSVLSRPSPTGLHYWEKKMMICLIQESKAFSDREIIDLCDTVKCIPDTEVVHEYEGRKYYELCQVEDDVDFLYSESGEFCGKLLCPQYKCIMTEHFAELMISILALSCDDIIQPKVLGKWIPFFRLFLQRNQSLMQLFARHGQNKLLQLIFHRASK